MIDEGRDKDLLEDLREILSDYVKGENRRILVDRIYEKFEKYHWDWEKSEEERFNWRPD